MQQYLDSRKIPLQSSGFENLPREIAAIIFGRLSFADLIVAKNVCRRFNILCKAPAMAMVAKINKLIYVDYFFANKICQCGISDKLSRIIVSMYGESEFFDKDNKILLECHMNEILGEFDQSERCAFLFVMKYFNFEANYLQYILAAIIRRILKFDVDDGEKVAFFRLFYLADGKMTQKRRREIILREIERHGENHVLKCKLAAIVLSGDDYAAFILRLKN